MIFPAIADIVPEGVLGIAQVVHDRPSSLEIMHSAWHGMHTADRTHTRLLVGGRLMMTDAAFEHRTNYEVTREARGSVLIAGLGIGMILTKILAKDSVQAVTVVEKYQDVIALVGLRFACPKLTIVAGDIFAWSAPKGELYDVIYFDIWPDLCTDNLKEMTTLHRRFRKHLRPDGWMNSWCREYLRAEKRRESRSGW